MSYLIKIFYLLIFLINKPHANELKIAVLKYGSVNWELDVLYHHKLDEKFDLNIKKDSGYEQRCCSHSILI